MLPLAEVPELEGVHFGVALGAGEETAQLLAEVFGLGGVDLDAFTAEASSAARDVIFRNVEAVNVESVQAIREIIAGGIERGESPAVIAHRIRSVIGLDARRAGALAKAELELLASGLSPEEVASRIEQLRQQKLLSRAYAWSRTGNLESAMRGQLELWRQAKRQGLLQADLRSQFEGVSGPLDGPPAHPHCLCAVLMELDDNGVFRRRWIRVPAATQCPICESYEGQVI